MTHKWCAGNAADIIQQVRRAYDGLRSTDETFVMQGVLEVSTSAGIRPKTRRSTDEVWTED